MPVPVLPEMTLRSAGLVPPIVNPPAPVAMLMPPWARAAPLPRIAPVASRPIVLPAMVALVPASSARMPARPLPLIRLSRIVTPAAPFASWIPSQALPRAAAPAPLASVPM